jgi:hypothetical protein
MDFLKDLLRNLALLLIIGVVLFILFPDTMKQVFQLYGALFGPLAIILLVVAALPRKRRR